jgi:predicted transposase/invertase (TIGR01784 family)
MTTDQLAYEVFVADPGSYFEMIGEPRSVADQYVFEAVDIKAVARRLDGFFRPKEASRPLHFVEVLFYSKENVYANLLVKVFLKLEQEPTRNWQAAIIFESASLIPKVEEPYRELLESNRVKRVVLETLPEQVNSGLGLSILKLVTKDKEVVGRDANLLVRRLRSEVQQELKQTKLFELIEFVVISRLSELSKEEVRAMLELEDYRKSRFYQEAKEDGVEEGFQQGKVEGKEELLQQLVIRMASKGRSAEQIADDLGMELTVVNSILGRK